ncbi:hypothetical protein OIU80_16365 [Flavobacterium sp. LS1R47]|uniref:RHS repeat-associated protein n=1 Tax=Flavobacterium frigoritolerans TaxID=2987686 RepID=A0A9X3C931_9FLAO|nr:RHS repeat-associated core domain-containing protein [Flavobacterium frigoritolerans]MCV9933859.1 hypothetical protein [Flavobacterium frigoritolerans]
MVEEDNLVYDKPEPIENLITWVYEEGNFVPSAKIIDEEKFSIVNDYIGRPVQVYSELGELVWESDYDIYGGLKDLKGDRSFIPFRQLGQYEDVETGLHYNRHRYYSSDMGLYLSQDPIGLLGGSAFYAYVHDSNAWTDILGLQGNLYDIVNYGNKSTDLFNHHNVMDAWAKNNIPGYISRQSAQPTIQLTKEMHDAAHAAERKWMKDNFGKVRGNWDKITARQAQELSEVMFDAAKVPKSAREEFYRKFNKYIYTKCK